MLLSLSLTKLEPCLVCIGLVLALGDTVEGAIHRRKDTKGSQWWENTIVYQIYPRSFKDSNNDGTGDLKGIESELDYFVDLGIETIWLSPIFKSPMKDFGYDISDFNDIDPIFGTMKDFKDLLQGVHERGMKLILDLVPNHSSDEHEWFKKSLRKEEPYTDYYTWRDPSGFDENGEPIPPNNWVSVFCFSMWQWEEKRQQFYLHQFVPGQPDLNYRNPAVQKEMENVIRFWLELGVDGFRQDAVAHIWEDDQFLDEPLSGKPNTNADDYAHYQHIYTTNLPETRDVLKNFFNVFKEVGEADGYPRVTMLEVWGDPAEQLKYYNCSNFPFNFGFLLLENLSDPTKILATIDNVLNSIPKELTKNWILGNHDRWRVSNRGLNDPLIDAFNILTLGLPGVTVTYYGEELGMTNNMNISFENTVDPSGCNCGSDLYLTEFCSRDPERTPMQWNNQVNAGFNNGAKPWLPINSNADELNVESQRYDSPSSHWNNYRIMANLKRSHPAFASGEAQTQLDGNVLAVARTSEVDPDSVFVILINFVNTDEEVDILGDFHSSKSEATVVLGTLGKNGHDIGDVLQLSSFVLRPFETVVLQY